MLTGEYAILVMGPPYYKDVCFFLYKEAHFYACSLLFSSSLRNPWVGDRVPTCQALIGLARVVAFQGDLAAARRLYQECLAMLHETGCQEFIPTCLEGMGVVLAG